MTKNLTAKFRLRLRHYVNIRPVKWIQSLCCSVGYNRKQTTIREYEHFGLFNRRDKNQSPAVNWLVKKVLLSDL